MAIFDRQSRQQMANQQSYIQQQRDIRTSALQEQRDARTSEFQQQRDQRQSQQGRDDFIFKQGFLETSAYDELVAKKRSEGFDYSPQQQAKVDEIDAGVARTEDRYNAGVINLDQFQAKKRELNRQRRVIVPTKRVPSAQEQFENGIVKWQGHTFFQSPKGGWEPLTATDPKHEQSLVKFKATQDWNLKKFDRDAVNQYRTGMDNYQKMIFERAAASTKQYMQYLRDKNQYEDDPGPVAQAAVESQAFRQFYDRISQQTIDMRPVPTRAVREYLIENKEQAQAFGQQGYPPAGHRLSSDIQETLNSGHNYLLKGSPGDAKQSYTSVLQNDPYNVAAHHGLATVAISGEQKNFVAAERHIKTALEGEPNNPVLWADAGWILFLQNKVTDSEGFLLKSLDLDNWSTQKTLNNLAILYATQGQDEFALEVLRKTTESEDEAQARLKEMKQTNQKRG